MTPSLAATTEHDDSVDHFRAAPRIKLKAPAVPAVQGT